MKYEISNFLLFYVDKIGILTSVGIERKLLKGGRKMKINVIFTEASG